jgi:hypothetical protein
LEYGKRLCTFAPRFRLDKVVVRDLRIETAGNIDILREEEEGVFLGELFWNRNFRIYYVH